MLLKRLLPLLLLAALLLCVMPAAAAGEITVYINLSVEGEPALGSSGLPIVAYALQLPAGAGLDEAFRTLHGLECPAGEDGYATVDIYGLSLPMRVWGRDLDTGCYPNLNGQLVRNTAGVILQDGDRLSCSVFDPVSYEFYGGADFQAVEFSAAAGEEITLTARVQVFNRSTYGVSDGALRGGRILMNGSLLPEIMDENGSVTLAFHEPGIYYLVANNGTSAGPAMCRVTVGMAQPGTSGGSTGGSTGGGGGSKAQGVYDAAAGTYVVAPGDCLWDICAMIYGTGAKWGQVWAANAGTVSDPGVIYAGQVLLIP